jgi:pimeloyl-ACP methyl ester carboxylesterase
MLNFISESVLVNGIDLHYYRTEGDKPPLVLAHGITDDGLCWLPVAEILAEDFNIIMMDARGHGRSDAPESGYTLQNLGMELAGMVQALKLNKPILLGHSMGAITALVAAGLHPAMPRAILLEDPPPFWMVSNGQPRDPEFVNGFAAWINAIKRKTRDELLSECQEQNPAWSEAEFDPWVNSKQRVSPRVTALIDPPDMTSIDMPHLFKKITCPALFISAEVRLGAASKAEDIDQLKNYIPQLQATYIAGAGHNIRREQFASYLRSIQSYLQGL